MNKESEEPINESLVWDFIQYEEILITYALFAVQSELIDEEADILEALFTKAESDSVLDFLLSEVDFILGQRLGLLDTESVEQYKDQQAWLREHLDQVPSEKNDVIALQTFLQDMGFYKGPLDGIFGTRCRSAVIEYRQQVQHLGCIPVMQLSINT